MKCDNCKADLVEGARFCIRCGAPVTQQAAHLDCGGRHCPHCGAQVSMDAKFCNSCAKCLLPETEKQSVNAGGESRAVSATPMPQIKKTRPSTALVAIAVFVAVSSVVAGGIAIYKKAELPALFGHGTEADYISDEADSVLGDNAASDASRSRDNRAPYLIYSGTSLRYGGEEPLFNYDTGGCTSQDGETLYSLQVNPDNEYIIPKDVKYPCSDVYLLEGIQIDPENPYLKIENSALMSSDGTILFRVLRDSGEWNEGERYVVPDGVRDIAAFAFANVCYMDRQAYFWPEEDADIIVLPDSVRNIGDYAFAESGARMIEMPDTLDTLGIGSLGSCSRLSYLAIPGLETFTDTHWFDCSFTEMMSYGPAEIEMGEGLEEISAETFYGQSSLERVLLPSTLKIIGEDSFSCCDVLTYVSMPEGLKEIKAGAFEYCVSLTDIDFPAGVTVIEPETFLDCDSLSIEQIPDTVKEIRDSAFDGCESLTELYIPARVKIKGDPFSRCDNLVIHTPRGSAAHTYAKDNNIPFVLE